MQTWGAWPQVLSCSNHRTVPTGGTVLVTSFPVCSDLLSLQVEESCCLVTNTITSSALTVGC